MNEKKEQIKLILDLEWIQLMKEAKEIGLTPRDVLMFLKGNEKEG